MIHPRKRPFTASLKEQAWNTLQDEIDIQLKLTPGEYDQWAIVYRLSRRMVADYGLEFEKVVDYLETRYKEQE